MSVRAFRLILAVAALVAATAGLVLVAWGIERDRVENNAATIWANPTTDSGREVCRQFDTINTDIVVAFDPEKMRPIGAAAANSSDPEIKAIGLAMVPLYAYDGPEPGQESGEAARLFANLTLACTAKYGDGPAS